MAAQDFLNGVCTNIIHMHQKQLKYYTGEAPAGRCCIRGRLCWHWPSLAAMHWPSLAAKPCLHQGHMRSDELHSV